MKKEFWGERDLHAVQRTGKEARQEEKKSVRFLAYIWLVLDYKKQQLFFFPGIAKSYQSY